MSKSENPPAFPSVPHEYNTSGGMNIRAYGQQAHGMTLRDWFAGQAPDVPKWFEAEKWDEKQTVPWPEKGPTWVRETIVKCYESPVKHLTRWRYAYADAMLTERAKTP